MITPFQSGFLLVNKPAGPTSFGTVATVKKLLPRGTKVGHTGTLDDFASGLLIICIGREATRQSSALMSADKEYVVKAKFGELRDSLDWTGKITQTMPHEHISEKELITAMRSLQPSYFQIPPVYSALKHNGSPLYKLARYNHMEVEKLEQIVQNKGREVKIKEIELLELKPPFFTIRAFVSKGTYVRSLANDIAQRLNCVATTYELERTRIHEFLLHKAIQQSEIKNIEDIKKCLLSIHE
jgi:tRNA pseudouridine55 synthase